MDHSPEERLTKLMNLAAQGDAGAKEHLWRAINEQLRALASTHGAKETPGTTLQATAVVNEAFLKLLGTRNWNSRAHFFGSAANAMRQILADAARHREAQKRGGGKVVAELNEHTDPAVCGHDPALILGVHEAIDRLAEVYPTCAPVVHCRFFIGLNERETANALGVSRGTVQKRWKLAKAWFRRELGKGDTTFDGHQ